MSDEKPSHVQKVFVQSFLHFAEVMRKDYDLSDTGKNLDILNATYERAKLEALEKLEAETSEDTSPEVKLFRFRLSINMQKQFDKRLKELEQSRMSPVSTSDSTTSEETDQTALETRIPVEEPTSEQLLEEKSKELEELKAERDRMSNEIYHLRQQLATLTVEAQGVQHSEISNEIVETTIPALEPTSEQLLEEKSKELEELKAEHDRMSNEIHHEHDRMSNEIHHLRQKLAIITNEARGVEHSEMSNEIVELRNQLDETKAQYEQQVETNSMVMNEFVQVHQELEACKAQANEMMEIKDRQLQETQQLCQELEARNNDLTELMEIKDRQLQETQQERDRMAAEIAELRQQLEARNNDLTELETRQRTQVENLKRSWTQRLKVKEDQLNSKIEELTKLQEDIAVFRQDPNQLWSRKDAELNKLEAEIKDKNKQIDDLSALIHEVDSSSEVRKSHLERKLQMAKARYNVTERAFQDHKKGVTRMVQVIEQLVERMSNPRVAPQISNECGTILAELQRNLKRTTSNA